MCVVSMIADHYYDKWNRPPYIQPIVPKSPSKEEIDEFYKLLERAREYDKKYNEPDCELEGKKKKLLDLAKELGIEIKFDG